jgi:hypothetical protein
MAFRAGSGPKIPIGYIKDYLRRESANKQVEAQQVCVSMELNWSVIGIVFLGYWALCRFLRWRRLAFVHNKFKGRDPYSLTIDEAQWITHQFFQYEMPALARFSTAFALFRTYGIESIAEILIKYSPLPVLLTRSEGQHNLQIAASEERGMQIPES